MFIGCISATKAQLVSLSRAFKGITKQKKKAFRGTDKQKKLRSLRGWIELPCTCHLLPIHQSYITLCLNNDKFRMTI